MEMAQEIKTKVSSALEYQGYTQRAGKIFVKWLRESKNHLHCSYTMVERRYTSIALFERLPSKFRLLLNLDLIFRHQHSHDRYRFRFEKSRNCS